MISKKKVIIKGDYGSEQKRKDWGQGTVRWLSKSKPCNVPFHPQAPFGGRREPTLPCYPLTPMSGLLLEQVHPPQAQNK